LTRGLWGDRIKPAAYSTKEPKEESVSSSVPDKEVIPVLIKLIVAVALFLIFCGNAY